MDITNYGQMFVIVSAEPQTDFEESIINQQILEPNVELFDYDQNGLSSVPFMFEGEDERLVFIVKGDSMREAGIFEGDLAIVDDSLSADIGDLVVAEIDDQYSLRFLAEDEEGKMFLRSAGDAYLDEYADEFKIVGVVCSVVRNMR